MSRSELTVAECDELRSIALAMPVENIPVETRELAKQLQFIEATLPSKNTDEQSGQMRTAVYARILGGYTKEALSYMTERVCKELDWFPRLASAYRYWRATRHALAERTRRF
jgi:hypothetical protein